MKADFTIKSRLTSKRNLVYLVELEQEPAIYKEYRVGSQAREVAILQKLQRGRVAVPQILQQGDGWLLLEYLAGQNLCDFLRDSEAKGEDGLVVIGPLLCWLQAYWQTIGEARGDVNLRNFIWQSGQGRLYGIDFEDQASGTPVEDVARILAYAISYQPSFSIWKQKWVQAVFVRAQEILGLGAETLRTAYQRELSLLAQRWGIEVPSAVGEIL